MMLPRLPFIALALACVAHSNAWALEIRNLRCGQQGTRAFVQYDLTGKPGEKEAAVSVSIELGGERYKAEQLAVAGDLGPTVPVGIAKQIWWDLLKDMPAGYDGDISWTLDARLPVAPAPSAKGRPAPPLDQHKPGQVQQAVASPAIAPKNGIFRALDHAVVDARTGLMWAKLGNDTTEKFTYSRAVSYVAKMNREKFGGFDDWRLPDDSDVHKLFASTALISSKTGRPAMKVLLHYFPNLENWHYWQDFPTSRLFGKGAYYKRSFDIEDGSATGDLESDELSILPVRTVMTARPNTVRE